MHRKSRKVGRLGKTPTRGLLGVWLALEGNFGDGGSVLCQDSGGDYTAVRSFQHS